MKGRTGRIALAAMLAFGITAVGTKSAGAGEFSFKWGAGAGLAPDYWGSDDYIGLAFPILGVAWKGEEAQRGSRGYVFALDLHDASVDLREGVKAGLLHIGTPDRDNMLSLGFGLGRSRDADDNDVLNGMGNIDTHALAKVSLEGSGRDPSRPDWHYALTFSQDISDEHDGASIDAGIGYSWPLWERWKLTTEVGITWASDDFTQAHFGVTTSQANLSGNTAYTAESGIVEATANATLQWKINKNLGVLTALSYGRLLGDAADSPLVDVEGDANQLTFIVGTQVTF